jgi:hypothetical protein
VIFLLKLRGDVAAAELTASQALTAELLERAELRDVSVLSTSAILCSNLSKSIALRCTDNVQREKELINLLVRQSLVCDAYTMSTVTILSNSYHLYSFY